MKPIEPAVKKETAYIAGWSLLLSVVMELVFWAVGAMDYTVPLGNLLGVAASLLNFFLMGLTIQSAVGLEEKAAAAKLKLSQMLRMLMVLVLAVLGLALPCFHTIAVLVPFFFPRIAISFRPLFDRKGDKA